MTVPAVSVSIEDEEFYPLHEEDNVAEIPDHELQNGDLRAALRVRFPDAFVTGNACVYWEKGNRDLYVAPDVFVVRHWRPPQKIRTYRTWEHPPVDFIIEVLSLYDYKPRQESMEGRYSRDLHVPEYLSFHMERKELKLRRLGPDGYEEVLPEPNGRVRSQVLQLDFGMDETGFLRVYTLDGRKLPTAEEYKQLLADEERRRALAERRATDEAERRTREVERRREAEARASDEARQRQEAEARAAGEARQRQEAEARAATEARQREALERQIAELRSRLQEQLGEQEI